MSIKQTIKCKCGARYKVSQQHAGKKVKCKKCDHTFMIPQPAERSAAAIPATPFPATSLSADPNSSAAESATALLNPYGSPSASSDSVRQCPSCNRNIGKGKVVCIYCGYHTDLGRKLEVNSNDESNETESTSSDLEIKDVVPGLTGVMTILASIGMIVLTAAMNSQFEGPGFLLYFYVCFILSAFTVVAARKLLIDHDIFNDAAIIMLLGMGAARIYYSVTNERYKFLFLIFGMMVVFGVFFISKVRGRDSDDSPFVDSAGGMALGPFLFLFACAAMILGMTYFIEPIRNAVAGFLVYLLFGTFMAISGGISKVTGQQVGSGRGFGYGSYSSCSSCSSCGGGCGGGCGGCGG